MLALTGLRAESRSLLAASPCENIDIVCTASDPGRARSLFMAKITATQPERLLSFGIAGGLAPELPAGSIIIADQVFVDGVSHRSDLAWTQQLLAALPQARLGSVEGTSAIVATKQQKAALHSQHQALACDMESAIIAAVGLPFACLRVVCDPADFALPPAALLPLRENGTPHLLEVMGSLLQQPEQLPALLALRQHYRAAMYALVVAARAVA